MAKVNGKDFLLGAAVGGVIGAVSALLFAPKAGKELRADISDGYSQVAEKTKKIAGDVGERTQAVAKSVSGRTQEWVGKAKGIATKWSADGKAEGAAEAAAVQEEQESASLS